MYSKKDIHFSNDSNAIKLKNPLSKDLENCYAMVSFHSMCAVHAGMAGVPSFCSEHSPAYPVSLSLKELDQIKDPLYTPEREKWIENLLANQFTMSEIKNGTALKYVNAT